MYNIVFKNKKKIIYSKKEKLIYKLGLRIWIDGLKRILCNIFNFLI